MLIGGTENDNKIGCAIKIAGQIGVLRSFLSLFMWRGKRLSDMKLWTLILRFKQWVNFSFLLNPCLNISFGRELPSIVLLNIMNASWGLKDTGVGL